MDTPANTSARRDRGYHGARAGRTVERQRVDNAAADRGRAVYAQHCINCHGSTAKGTERGPDLIRSAVVLRDRLGNGIGPAIQPAASHQADADRRRGRRSLALPAPARRSDRHQSQRARAAQRAHRRSRGRPRLLQRRRPVQHVPFADRRSGRPRARAFRTPSTCSSDSCFPTLRRGGGKQVEVTVTVGERPPVTGALVRIDDFFVSLRDASGEYRSFNRGPASRSSCSDPLAAHHELLDRYTDADMHNLTTYLARLQMRLRGNDSEAPSTASIGRPGRPAARRRSTLAAQGTLTPARPAQAARPNRGRCTTATTRAAASAR